jgi:acetyl-CoA carboxylase biotin carboxyl carrier protein
MWKKIGARRRVGVPPLKIDESALDKLADILKRHNLSEVEYGDGDIRIKLTSYGKERQVNVSSAPPSSVCIQQTQDSSVSDQSEKDGALDLASHAGAVKSPMVGTCYLSPEPGAKNFVTLGDVVQNGQPILIIEAMKVMNLIKSQKAGKIIHIAVSNLDPIEYGQLLFVIE